MKSAAHIILVFIFIFGATLNAANPGPAVFDVGEKPTMEKITTGATSLFIAEQAEEFTSILLEVERKMAIALEKRAIALTNLLNCKEEHLDMRFCVIANKEYSAVTHNVRQSAIKAGSLATADLRELHIALTVKIRRWHSDPDLFQTIQQESFMMGKSTLRGPKLLDAINRFTSRITKTVFKIMHQDIKTIGIGVETLLDEIELMKEEVAPFPSTFSKNNHGGLVQ